MTQTLQPPIGPSAAFAYQAQTLEGQPITGTIDASDADQAQRLLASLRLRVLNVEPAPTTPAVKPKALAAGDFLAFNQQLAHLTSSGMPIEQGLRLIAQDMHSGRLAATVRELATELERGTPLQQAFEKHRDRFPPLYAGLVGAGVATGNLPGLLMNLGRHVELVQRLRAALWRATAYPLMVLIGVGLVVIFSSLAAVPQFDNLFSGIGMGMQLPALTRAMLMLPFVVPWVLLALAVVAAVIVVIYVLLRRSGRSHAVIERFALPLPLIGPILRYNLLARWIDSVGLPIGTGLDLPRAIEMADDAVGSPALRHDGEELRAALLAGKPLDSVQHTRLVPATVIAAMSLASNQQDLPSALRTLSEMYQQQAQLRLSLL